MDAAEQICIFSDIVEQDVRSTLNRAELCIEAAGYNFEIHF